jgi:hypothetical protein
MKKTFVRVVLLVTLVAATSSACDTSPLVAPVASKIAVSVSSTTVQPGGTIEVMALVTKEAGATVQNGTTVWFSATLGSVAETAQTVDGVARVTFTAGSVAGTARVTATSGAATAGDPSNVVEIVIG